MPNPSPSKKYEQRFKDIKCYRAKRPPLDEFYRPFLMSIELSRPKKSCCCSRTQLHQPYYPCPQCNPNEVGPYSRHPAYLNNLTCTGNNGCGSCATGNAATCSQTGPCGNTAGNVGCNQNPGNNPGNVSSCGRNIPNGNMQGSCGQISIGGGGGGCASNAGFSGSGSCNGGGGGGGGSRCNRLPGQGPCDPPCFSTMIFPRYAPYVSEPRCQPHPIIPRIIADGCFMAPVGGTSMYGAFTRSCFTCNNCGVPGQVDVCSLPAVGCNNAACASGFIQNGGPCGSMGPPGPPGGGSYPGINGRM